jgi:hypothetical protein
LEVKKTGPFQHKEIADTILAQIIFAFCSEVNGKTKAMVFVVNNSVSKTYVSKKRMFVKIHSAAS